MSNHKEDDPNGVLDCDHDVNDVEKDATGLDLEINGEGAQPLDKN